MATPTDVENPSNNFFGIDATQFVEQIQDATTVYSKDGLKAMDSILREDSETGKSVAELDAGFPKVEAKLMKILDKNFDKFELYAQRNILRIPAHVDPSGGLPEAWLQDCSTSATEEDEAVLDSELADLRRKIQRTQYAQLAIKHKLNEYTTQLEQANSVLAVLDEAEQAAAGRGVSDLPHAFQTLVDEGKLVRQVEEEYTRVDQQADGMAGAARPEGNVLAACRAGVGSASTRELKGLVQVLGASVGEEENSVPN